MHAINDHPAFVIGGAEVFRQFLPLAGELLLTRIHASYEGDAYFPAFNPEDWHLASVQELLSSQGIKLSFERYLRN